MAAILEYGTELRGLVRGSIHMNFVPEFLPSEPCLVQRAHLGAAQVCFYDGKKRPRGPCLQRVQDGRAAPVSDMFQNAEIVSEQVLFDHKRGGCDLCNIKRGSGPFHLTIPKSAGSGL